MRKFNWLLAVVAVAIAAYAVHGLLVQELVMPYKWWGGGPTEHTYRYTATRYLHLRGIWATAGSICLLLSAAGCAIVFFEQLAARPATSLRRKLAIGMILVGGLFFLAISNLTQWLVR